MEEITRDFKNQDWDLKKRYLKRYRKNQALIERLNRKIELLDQRSEGVKSPKYTGMPRGGIPVTPFDMKDEKSDLLSRVIKLKQKGEIFKREILEAIDSLDDPRYAEVLESFFIDCKDLDTIAEEMGYSVRHVKNLYSKGISNITLVEH